MIPAAFEYQRATTRRRRHRRSRQRGAKVLAGGHSLLPLLKLRLARPTRWSTSAGSPSCKGIRTLPDGGVEIGALTTYAEMAGGDDVTRHGPRRSTDDRRRPGPQPGDDRRRHRPRRPGLGPAGDLARPRLLGGPSRDRRGERVVPLDDVLPGPVHRPTIADDEILVAIRRRPIPRAPAPPTRSWRSRRPATRSSASRRSIARSGGSISHARIGVTGVHEHAYRAPEVEAALVGSDGSAAAIAAAAEHATSTSRSTATSTPIASTGRRWPRCTRGGRSRPPSRAARPDRCQG